MVLQELIVCSDKSAEVAELIGLPKRIVQQSATVNKPRAVAPDEDVYIIFDFNLNVHIEKQILSL